MERDRQRVRTTLQICGIVTATAVVIALAVPTLAGAAGTLMTVADGDNVPTQAQVEGGGLRVGGTVNVRRSTPADARHGRTEFVGTSSCRSIVAPAAGKALVISSVRVDAYATGSTPGAAIRIWVQKATSSPCSFGSPGVVAIIPVSQPGSQQELFDPGINVPAGYTVTADQYLRTSSVTAAHAVVYVDGYHLTSTAVPESSTSTESSESPSGRGASGTAE